MKKIYLIICLVALWPLQMQAQDLDNSLLWKISGKDLTAPSYLFGTIHMICPDDLVVKDYFKSTLAKTEQVVFELDMDDPQLMTQMQQFGINEGMKNITTEMTDEEQKVVNDFLQKNYGLSLQQLGIMKPFALMTMVLPKYLDCNQPASYEQLFIEEAQKSSLDILGIETVEFQMGILDEAPIKRQIEMLVESITDSTKMKEEFDQMVASYQKQDLNTLYQVSKENPQYAEFEDALINDRNESWVAPMEGFMQDKSTFFAVGALHLAGTKGVIKLLRNAGYKVEPVKN